MDFRIIVFSIAVLIYAETRAEVTDDCESKAEASASLDLAIQLMQKVKNYHNQDRTKESYSKEVCTHPMDCEDVLRNGENKSGIYTVWPRSRIARKPIEVYCDMDTDGGGWTVFQRRGDFGKPKDFFFQDWNSYKTGFGDIDKDFWLGNNNIFALSNQRDYSLRIDLRDVEGEKVYALYDTFWIDNEGRNYTLHIAEYSGDAGDSMIWKHNRQKFSTKDRRNDKSPFKESCAEQNKGGWWYNSCYESNLNGLYHKGPYKKGEDGVCWKSYRGYKYSLEWTEMKIRSMDFSISGKEKFL